jgi:hypothetical protein
MQKIQKKYEQDVPLKRKICLRWFQSGVELENHDILEHQRDYSPLGVG